MARVAFEECRRNSIAALVRIENNMIVGNATDQPVPISKVGMIVWNDLPFVILWQFETNHRLGQLR